MIRVLVFKDGEKQQTLEFSKSEVIFGREREADVQLFAAAVSRRHARLSKVADGWQIADLGAANGVYVSQGEEEPERVVIHTLRPGDKIHIETFVVQVDTSGDTVQPATPSADFDESFANEVSLETKRTQFISMHDVLNGPGGERLKAMGVTGGIDEASAPETPDAATHGTTTWWAQMSSDDGHSRVFTIDGAHATVGTSSSCDIVLPAGPSQVVELSRAGATVNLTRTSRWPFPRVTVDGRVVKEALLNHGDSFHVGKFEVEVSLTEPVG